MVSDLITYGKLRLDRKAHRIYISDEAVGLHYKTGVFYSGAAFMEHPKQVFSKEDILNMHGMNHIWGNKTLDVHISNIRKKLKKNYRDRIYRDCLGNRI